MHITPQQLEEIENVAKRLAPKYVFPGYDLEDIIQEAIIIGLNSFQLYDESRGTFSAYMYVHINNRLKTLKRDKYYRPLPMNCKECLGAKSSVNEDELCPTCQSRAKRNETKRGIASPVNIGEIDIEEARVEDALEIEEARQKIADKLPMDMREDYLRMLDDFYVPKARRLLIEEEIRGILHESTE
jgi:RNA polymerase sigma factor (sigma-70 family)